MWEVLKYSLLTPTPERIFFRHTTLFHSTGLPRFRYFKRSATLLVTKQQIEQLEENLSLQNSCITKTNALDFFNIDDDFHKLLADIAQCSLAWEIIDSNKATVDRVRYLLLSSITPPEILVTQHTAIVAMLKSKNSEKAANAMKKHLNEINISVSRIYQQHQNWFLDDL